MFNSINSISNNMQQLATRWCEAPNESMSVDEREELYQDTEQTACILNRLWWNKDYSTYSQLRYVIIQVFEKNAKPELLGPWVGHNTSFAPGKMEFIGAYEFLVNELISRTYILEKKPKIFEKIQKAAIECIEANKKDFSLLNDDIQKLIYSQMSLKDLLSIHKTSKSGKRRVLVSAILADCFNEGKITLRDLGLKKEKSFGKDILTCFGESCSEILKLDLVTAYAQYLKCDLETLQVDDFNFLQYFPNLKELTLGANFRVNDFSFLQFCKKLEIFNVDRAFQIEDPYPFLLLYNTNLSDLRYCENLKSLRLRGLYNLTDLTILQPCENLKFLDLRNCEKLTDLRPLQTLKNLETVDIRNCEKIEDLSPLLECPNLKRLICSHVNCMLWPYQEGLWQDHLKKLMDKGVEIVKTNDTWKAI